MSLEQSHQRPALVCASLFYKEQPVKRENLAFPHTEAIFSYFLRE